MSTPSEEIELLERVVFRLGTADTDEQFENTILKFLTPVLLKITSPHENVRCKVMEVLTHVNKRLKSRSKIQLPIEALLEQYQSSNVTFLHNFSIIYVTMGFPRLPIEKQMELTPNLLNCLEGKSENHQEKLLLMVLPLFETIKIPEDDDKRNKMFSLSDKPKTKKKFLLLLQEILLLPYGTVEQGELPPGLCPYAFKLLSSLNWKAEELEQLKKGICRLLCANVYPDIEILPLLVLASADTRFSVVTPAVAALSKINTSLDWTQPTLSAPFYTIFLGNDAKIMERKTSPCSARVRQKILQYLLKGKGKAVQLLQGIQVIFEGVFGKNTNLKCKVLSLQFAVILIDEAPIGFVTKLTKVLLNGFLKVIGQKSEEPGEVQRGAYRAIEHLAKRSPTIFGKDVVLATILFEDLLSTAPELHDSIRDTLFAIASAIAQNNSSSSSSSANKKESNSDELRKAAAAADKTVNDVNHLHELKESLKFVPDANQVFLLTFLEKHITSDVKIQNVICAFLTKCYPEHFVPARYQLLLIAGYHSAILETIMSHLYGVSRQDQINYNEMYSIDILLDGNNNGDNSIEKSSLTVHDNQINLNDINEGGNRLIVASDGHKIILPSFAEMICHFNDMYEERLKNKTIDKYNTYGNSNIPYTYQTIIEIVTYLRHCLWFSAGCRSKPGDEKQKPILKEWLIRKYTAPAAADNPIHIYLTLLKNILKSYKHHGEFEFSCLYDLISSAPDILAESCFNLMDFLCLKLKDVTETIRIIVAKILGILIAYGCSDHEFNNKISGMYNLTNKTIEHQHGCVLAVAYAFNSKIKCLKAKQLINANDNEYLHNWIELKEAIKIIAGNLKQPQLLILTSAIQGLSLIGSVTELQTETNSQSSTLEEFTYDVAEKDEIENVITRGSIARTIYRLLKSAHTHSKLKEESALCLGALAIGDGKYFAKANLKVFRGMVKLSKDVVLNIALAQSIVSTILGQDSHSFDDSQLNPHCDDESMLNDFVQDIIKAVIDPNPCSRQATSIWLLALVKHCAKRPAIYTKKQLLQYAFTDLLSDDSEFVQDVASRGLGLVYSLCDESAQSDLANSLLQQLIGGRRDVRVVSDDTELFVEGQLGKTPTGGNISTYKELCGLASDLNQPEMIYQFLQLANHNATWNSKLGAAFGLKSISYNAKSQMQPYLGSIVPRLYRYRYDPTPKIQNSMISIWDSIVTSTKETVELYYWEIFNELVVNLTNNEWRVRIACCMAIRDLIKRPNGLRLKYKDNLMASYKEKKETLSPIEDNTKMDVDQPSIDAPATEEHMKMNIAVDDVGVAASGEIKKIPEPELAELWSQLFRVMDDVHEGTRVAADGTVRTLSKICIQSAAENYGKTGDIVASSILPLILERGVTNTVPEIRKISIKTLSELIEGSGSLLTHHLPTLVPYLLQATGELEVPKLSYLSTRLGSHSDAQEVVDNVRAEVATQHLSMETLTKCIRHMDYNSFEKMTPAIIDLMKGSVNLGTKIACPHFLCLVSIRFNKEMAPLIPKYLAACFSGLKDRNNVVRKYYASAIGHLIGAAKDQSIIRLFQKLTEFYFEDQSNKGIPQTVMAINKRHNEMLKDYSQYALPLIFFAMHEEPNDINPSVIELWKELWLDISPGDSGIRLNLDSILELINKSMADSSWPLKAQCGNSISTIATKLETNLSELHRKKLINDLLIHLSGRTFEGKERLLQALSNLCPDEMGNKEKKSNVASSSTTPSFDPDLSVKIIDAVMKECRKEEPKKYRIHALKAIGEILEKFNMDYFEELLTLIWPIVEQSDETPSTGGGGAFESHTERIDERSKLATLTVQLKETICLTLGKAWPKTGTTQEKYQLQFIEKCCQYIRKNSRQVQVSLLITINKILERLNMFNNGTTAATTTTTTTTTTTPLPQNNNNNNGNNNQSSSNTDNMITDQMETDCIENNQEKKLKTNPMINVDLEQICKEVMAVIQFISTFTYTSTRKESLNIVYTLVQKLIGKQYLDELAMVKKLFNECRESFQKDNSPEIKCRLRDIDEKLKSI